MGGMAVTMALRLDESSGALPHVPVLMLLDRFADVHLARRSGADGWMVKPLDPLRLRRAVRAIDRWRHVPGGLRRDAGPPGAGLTQPPTAIRTATGRVSARYGV